MIESNTCPCIKTADLAHQSKSALNTTNASSESSVQLITNCYQSFLTSMFTSKNCVVPKRC